MKTQAKNLSEEYDRLSEEHVKLEKKLAISGHGDKKADWLVPKKSLKLIQNKHY